MKTFNWHCPHCNHKVTITAAIHSSANHYLSIKNAEGSIGIESVFIVCPNNDCRQPTLIVALRKVAMDALGNVKFAGEPIRSWRLIPQGDARPFPEFVPAAIREDYVEACLIRDLSPKASATLARRALQGILRDYYGVKVKGGKLVDEIDSLKETMDADLWEAIHGVRKVGNIGAHMEADINLIVEVDPDEAQLLIELVETMIEDTYVQRDARQRRVKSVKELAEAKTQARKALRDGSSNGPAGG